MSKLSSAQLAVMCEGVPVKRAMDKRYRYCMPSGKLSQPRHEAAPRYAKDAYRTDKKRVGSAPRGLWLGNVAKVNVAASRDY